MLHFLATKKPECPPICRNETPLLRTPCIILLYTQFDLSYYRMVVTDLRSLCWFCSAIIIITLVQDWCDVMALQCEDIFKKDKTAFVSVKLLSILVISLLIYAAS